MEDETHNISAEEEDTLNSSETEPSQQNCAEPESSEHIDVEQQAAAETQWKQLNKAKSDCNSDSKWLSKQEKKKAKRKKTDRQYSAKNKKVRISIRTKITVAFAALMILTVVGVWLANTLFLQYYYIIYKRQTLQTVYATINEIWDENIFEAETEEERQTAWEDIMPSLQKITDTYGISYLIADSSWTKCRASGSNVDIQVKRLQGYIYRSALEEDYNFDEKIVTQMVYYPDMGSYYLECWGTLDGGYPFIISVPLESIRESVAISNRFLMYIGAICIVIGSVLVFIISSSVTKPIRKLTVISQKIGELDFETKYQGREHDEIGVLGANMNQLSERLDTTITELKNANLELQKDIEHRNQLDEMRRDFISNVSHELKTPIALIQGYAEGLSDGMAEDEESRAFYCEVIADEADKMNKMVRKLLTLNQMEYGSNQITINRFEISELIRGVIANSHLLLEQNEIVVDNEIRDNLYVYGDEFQIEEVVSNYFSNAIHYCLNDKRIHVYAEEGEHAVRFCVHNTGNPIPEESLNQVWVKFYKVDKARTREYGGSGIGLSIVKAIMDAHNQPFGVFNTEDGVTFWFELEKA